MAPLCKVAQAANPKRSQSVRICEPLRGGAEVNCNLNGCKSRTVTEPAGETLPRLRA